MGDGVKWGRSGIVKINVNENKSFSKKENHFIVLLRKYVLTEWIELFQDIKKEKNRLSFVKKCPYCGGDVTMFTSWLGVFHLAEMTYRISTPFTIRTRCVMCENRIALKQFKPIQALFYLGAIFFFWNFSRYKIFWPFVLSFFIYCSICSILIFYFAKVSKG